MPRVAKDGRVRKDPYTPIRKDILRAFKPTDIVVFAAIAGHAWGNKNTATPSVATIRKLTRLSQPTVERAIRRLCTSLWYSCNQCGYAVIETPKHATQTASDAIRKVRDGRSEYELVMSLKKMLPAQKECPEAHKDGSVGTMDLVGPAIRRNTRGGSSNEYEILR